MRVYRKLGTEKKQDVEGKHYWLAVVAFAPGATVKMDDGSEVPITGNYVLRPSTHLGIVTPWKQITTTGAVTLLIGENHEPPPPNAGALVQAVPAPFIASDVIACPAANPAAQLVLATQVTRSVMIQNHGIFPVILSEVSNPTLAGGAGSRILAVLAACAVAYDGTGGSIVLDSMADSVFGVGKGGAADVSVNIW
jgi:hypothetical protein